MTYEIAKQIRIHNTEDDWDYILSGRLGQAMNIIKARKSRGAVCPRCTHPDYTMRPPIDGETTRPMFQCSACGHTWMYGQSGGIYAELALSNPPPQTE